VSAPCKRFVHYLAGPGFRLGGWNCTHDHRAPGGEQASLGPTINIVLRGMFTRHVGRRTVIADPTVAVLANADDTWRSSHPTGCGDAGVWVVLDPDQAPVDNAWLDRVRPLAPAAWLDWASLGPEADPEHALELIADVIGFGRTVSRAPPFVGRVRSILADRLRDPPSLEALAAEVGVSPWHLCRTFRAVTGATPRVYAEHLRLRAAARRIDDGCTDLSELAFELGYSSHSHLTARFRQVFGRTPTTLRTART
jgi:AraC family transcriptional regulator